MAKLTIVGTGLIGTSMALALKEANINNLEIVGTDYNRDSRVGAQKSGGFDKIENKLLNAIHDADIVILAVPVMAMEETMGYIAPELKEGCIVTDVGSTKRTIAEWASSILPEHVDYVGGHPMAGKEISSVEIELEKIIEKLKIDLVSKKELNRIKAQVLASEVYQRDSIDYQARILGMIKTSIGDIKLIDKYTSNIGSVTAEQVRKVARKYLVPNLQTVVKVNSNN